MLNLLTDSKRPTETYFRWVANTVINGISHRFNDFDSRLATVIAEYPEVFVNVKVALEDAACSALNATLDLHDRPSVDELYFRIAKVNGKIIHVEVDCEVCYRLGFTSYQFIGKELTEDIVPPEHLEYNKEAYERAWNGEIVDYIGVGHTGARYTAKLRPIYDHHNQIVFVEAICRFMDSIVIDNDVKDEMGEFQSSKYAFV